MLGFSLLGEEVLQAKAYPIWDGLFFCLQQRGSFPSVSHQPGVSMGRPTQGKQGYFPYIQKQPRWFPTPACVYFSLIIKMCRAI